MCETIIVGVRGSEKYLSVVDTLGLKFNDRKWHASGYGLYVVMPFIEDNYKENMTREECVSLIQNALLLLWRKFSVSGKNYIIAGVDSTGSFISDVKTLEVD